LKVWKRRQSTASNAVLAWFEEPYQNLTAAIRTLGGTSAGKWSLFAYRQSTFGKRRLLGCAAATSLIRKTVAFAAALGGEMMMADDATPVELWQRHAEESPHTSDDEIERLFIAAAKDNEDLIQQIMEWGFR
jgi:hypothetical protein